MKREQLEMLPRSRLEAQQRGFDRFFTGVPCKHGHLAARYVSTPVCVACQAEHARRRGGWQARPSKAVYLDETRKLVEKRGGVLLSTGYVSARTRFTEGFDTLDLKQAKALLDELAS